MKKYLILLLILSFFFEYNTYSQEKFKKSRSNSGSLFENKATYSSDLQKDKPIAYDGKSNIKAKIGVSENPLSSSDISPSERNDFRKSQGQAVQTGIIPVKGKVNSQTDKPYVSHIVLNSSEFKNQPVVDNDQKYTKQDTQKQSANTKGWNLIMSEYFEGSFPAVNWSAYAPSGYADVYWDDASCRSHTGGWSGYVGDLGSESFGCGENYVNNMKSIMQYGPFDLSDSDDAYMSYYWWANTEVDFDNISVCASIDGTNFYGNLWTGDHTTWNQYTFDLTDVYTLGDLTGYNQVWIAFFFESDESITEAEGAYIDDIELWKNVNSDYPDLQLTGGGFSPNPIPSDGTLVINAEIYNNGTAAASNSEIEYYLSTDETLDDSDYYLGNDYANLAPGATGTESISVDLNNGVNQGDYYVMVYFVDENNLWWWNETLEVIPSVTQNLIPLNGSFYPNPILVDGTLSIELEIQNVGTAPATNSVVEYYLSTDDNIEQSDYYLGNDYITLDPNEIGNESISVNLNSALTVGNYYVGMYVVDESDPWYFINMLEITSAGTPDIDVNPSSLTINESGKNNENDLLTAYDTKFKPINTEYVFDTIVDENGNIIYGMKVPGGYPPDIKMPVAIPSKGSVILSTPSFSWSFGCSATAASMAAGYYDNNGYPDMYNGPTNGGVCPMDNSSWPTVTINGESRDQCPLSATRNGLDGRTTRGHVDDYWVSYESSDTDPWITNGWSEHTWGDCTGDYMGTNQSSYENIDGATTFYYNENGTPLYDYTGSEPGARDGCHGLREFYESRGYNVVTNFTQLIYGYDGNTQGYTLANFQAQIDAGRPVLINVTGHTMLAVGYEDDGSGLIYIHDTWDYSLHSMIWGGSYSGMQHWGMTVVELEESAETDDFTITNQGSSDLSVNSISENANWLTLDGIPSTPFNLSPGSSEGFGVSVDWNLVGSNTQTADITILSNDPDESTVVVTVTAVPEQSYYLTVSPSSINVPANSGNTSFNISSNTSWTVSDNASWLSVSPSSGNNNAAINVSYSANSGSQRTGTITVYGSGVASQMITVTQSEASSGTLVSVNPDNQIVNTNEIFSTTIEITDVSNLGGFELNVVFDPLFLQANSVNLEDFLGSSGRQVFPLFNNINNTIGLIEYAATTLGATPPGPNGDGVLLTIEWTSATSIDEDVITDILLENLQITEPDGTIIPASSQNGIVNINSCYEHDFDCDCDVDIVDITMAAYTYGTSIGDPNYNIAYDLDNDGDIDIVDITMVTYDYGWSCGKNAISNTSLEEVNNENVLLNQKITLLGNGVYEVVFNLENFEQLGAYEFNLDYDPSNCRLLSTTESNFLSKTGRETFELANIINEVKGSITIAQTSLGSSTPGVSGSADVFKLKFKSLNGQVPVVNLHNAQFTRIDAQLIPFKHSIQNHEFNNQILAVYPNPANKKINIQYELTSKTIAQLKIYNTFGQLVYQSEIKNQIKGIHHIQLSDLNMQSGTYLIVLEDTNLIIDKYRVIVL